MSEQQGEALQALVEVLMDAARPLLAAGLSPDEVQVILGRRLGIASTRPNPPAAVPDPAAAGEAATVRLALAMAAPRPAEVEPVVDPVTDAPGEPPRGSVVTDAQSRVWVRSPEDGRWHGRELGAQPQALTWAQVRGLPDAAGQPGTVTLVHQPPTRLAGPMITRAGGSLELPMQVPVLDADGEVLLGPDGRKLLRTETETVEFSEVVPAGGDS